MGGEVPAEVEERDELSLGLRQPRESDGGLARSMAGLKEEGLSSERLCGKMGRNGSGEDRAGGLRGGRVVGWETRRRGETLMRKVTLQGERSKAQLRGLGGRDVGVGTFETGAAKQPMPSGWCRRISRISMQRTATSEDRCPRRALAPLSMMVV